MISAILLCEINRESGKNTSGMPKSLQNFQAKSYIAYTIDQILKSEIDELIVVLGDYHQEVEREIRKYFDSLMRMNKLRIVSREGRGVTQAIQSGLSFLNPACQAVFIPFENLAFLAHGDCQVLLREFRRTKKSLIWARHRGRMVSALLPAKLKHEVFALKPKEEFQTLWNQKLIKESFCCEVESKNGRSEIVAMSGDSSPSL